MINSRGSLENLFNLSEMSDLNKRKLCVIYEKLHCKTWCYKRLLKKYKIIYSSAMIGGLSTITASTIIGIFFPVALVCNSIGLLIQGIIKQKRLEEKLSNLKLIYTSYEKMMNDALKIIDSNDQQIDLLLEKIDWLDDLAIDICVPIPNSYYKLYKKKDLLNKSSKHEHDQMHL